MECIIRKMTREDCDAAAHVIAVCWKETYQGIIPEEELNRTDEQTIAENSRKQREAEEKKTRQEKEAEEKKRQQMTEVEETILEGRTYLEEIFEANEALEGEVIN